MLGVVGSGPTRSVASRRVAGDSPRCSMSIAVSAAMGSSSVVEGIASISSSSTGAVTTSDRRRRRIPPSGDAAAAGSAAMAAAALERRRRAVVAGAACFSARARFSRSHRARRRAT